MLLDFWRDCIVFWSRGLDLSFSRSTQLNDSGLFANSDELMTIGYVIIIATPVMLAVADYILNQSIWIKLFHTALILVFFAILVSHQVLAQAFIMQHVYVLFMHELYLCFAAVFDALVFVALYSWAVSNAPANATI